MIASDLDFSLLWHVAGWTMLQFLWTGAIVCLAAALVRFGLRGFSPQLRYAAMLTSLVILAALPLVVAVQLEKPREKPSVGELSVESGVLRKESQSKLPQLSTLNTQLPQAGLLSAAAAPEKPGVSTSGLGDDTVANSLTDPNAGLLNPFVAQQAVSLYDALQVAVPHLPWLWLVGTPFTFLWLAAGFAGAERLRRVSRPVHEGHLFNLCAKLTQALHITRLVGIAVCDRVAGPVLVGIVRPIILLPPSALTGWTPEQIEMVLLHELAHIRRWDNFVNLLQRIVEALLFFHPAVWMVSAWVRRDREACCDALVVARTGQPHRYAETLVALAASRMGTTLAASAYSRHPLAGRIRRILKLEDDSMLVSRRTWVLSLLTLVVLTSLGMSYLVQSSQANDAPEVERTLQNQLEITVDEQVITASSDGERIVLTTREGEPQQEEVDWTAPLNETDATDSAHRLFPSLEEQKMADRGWKMLGLELEKISEDDLKRVKQLGYSGGLKVAALDYKLLGDRPKVQIGDILVGLHVWPTIDLDHLGKVLSRDDLAELTPLKFYVLRRKTTGRGGMGMEMGGYGEMMGEGYGEMRGGPFDMEAQTTTASVVTGRIEVHHFSKREETTTRQRPPELFNPRDRDETPTAATSPDPRYGSPSSPRRSTPTRTDLDPFTETRDEAANTNGFGRGGYGQRLGRGYGGGFEGGFGLDQTRSTEVKAPGPVPWRPILALPTEGKVQGPVPPQRPQQELYYDGKSFEEWRDRWRTELKIEPRLEAVKALAAFGAAGRGKEAAEAILEIASQYDFTTQVGATGELKKACIDAFRGNAGIVPASIPAEDWFPLVIEAVRSEDPSWISFGAPLFLKLDSDDQFAIEPLLELSRTDSPQIREFVLMSLASIDSRRRDPRITRRCQELLSSDDPKDVLAALMLPHINSLDVDIVDYLLHADAKVRGRFRSVVLPNLSRARTDETVVKLLDRIVAVQTVNDRKAVIRALAAVGKPATGAIAPLIKLMRDTDENLAIRVAATHALTRITGTDYEHYEHVLRDAYSQENATRHNTPEFQMDFRKLERWLEEERRTVR